MFNYVISQWAISYIQRTPSAHCVVLCCIGTEVLKYIYYCCYF